VILQWFAPWQVALPHTQVLDSCSPAFGEAQAEAGFGPLTKLPDAS
jgi:hypothetical protein